MFRRWPSRSLHWDGGRSARPEPRRSASRRESWRRQSDGRRRRWTFSDVLRAGDTTGGRPSGAPGSSPQAIGPAGMIARQWAYAPAPLSVVETLLKRVVRLSPTAVSATMAATEQWAANSPYSIAVAPFSSLKNLSKSDMVVIRSSTESAGSRNEGGELEESHLRKEYVI